MDTIFRGLFFIRVKPPVLLAPPMSSSLSSANNIMLAVNEKKTVSVDIYLSIRNHLVEWSTLNHDLQTLNQMRASMTCLASVNSLASRRDFLQKYYRTLCTVETQLPNTCPSPTFTWHDAFKVKLKSSQQNIHLEKAAVLFNLGAVYSQIGLTYTRGSVDGRKVALRSFCAAAGAFAFLRDNESLKASPMRGSTPAGTTDLSVECAWMLERLMLAQAQECYYENAVAKGSSPGLC